MRDRYDLDDSAPPPNGRAATGDGLAAVADPLEPGARLQVSVNRRVDILEMERSQGLISNPAYLAGRFIMMLFERSRGARGGSAGPWREGGTSDAWNYEAKLVRALNDAATVVRYSKSMAGLLGDYDMALVGDILGDGYTYEQCALRRGRHGARARGYLAQRFREALEQISLKLADWD
jgi:hypothetical protein